MTYRIAITVNSAVKVYVTFPTAYSAQCEANRVMLEALARRDDEKKPQRITWDIEEDK